MKLGFLITLLFFQTGVSLARDMTQEKGSAYYAYSHCIHIETIYFRDYLKTKPTDRQLKEQCQKFEKLYVQEMLQELSIHDRPNMSEEEKLEHVKKASDIILSAIRTGYLEIFKIDNE